MLICEFLTCYPISYTYYKYLSNTFYPCYCYLLTYNNIKEKLRITTILIYKLLLGTILYNKFVTTYKNTQARSM